MPATTTRILLSHAKWEKQELLDRLTAEKSRNEFFRKAQVLDPFTDDDTDPADKSGEPIECNICFTEISQEVPTN